jgi:hypothetical protein
MGSGVRVRLEVRQPGNGSAWSSVCVKLSLRQLCVLDSGLFGSPVWWEGFGAFWNL